MSQLSQKAHYFLSNLEQHHAKRVLHTFSHGEKGISRSGIYTFLNFSSNDYLGLSNHPRVVEGARKWAEIYGAGVTASRLVCGTLELHEKIEEELAAFIGTETTLIFNSGFQANSSILPALLSRVLLENKPVVFADQLVHASLHQGCAIAGIRPIRFRHNDLNHLEFLLRTHLRLRQQAFIVTESVFSMDGDRADLANLASLAEHFGAILYIDEAHAIGLLGPGGSGLVSAEVRGRVDLIIGTFSKALGCFGAYVACSHQVRSYLINRCSGFIYSTALPPPILGAIEAALSLIPYMNAERRWVSTTSDRLRAALASAGFSTADSSTHIIPILLGRTALTVSRMLAEVHSLLAVAIRPPTVSTGRIRLIVSAAHDEAAIARLLSAIPSIVLCSAV